MRKLKYKNYTQDGHKLLKIHCLIGVPMSVRAAVWKKLCNVDSVSYLFLFRYILETNQIFKYIVNYPGTYDKLVSLSAETNILNEIERDLHRTFPTHIMFREKGGLGQQALSRVLIAYSNYNPIIGYCQGMGFIVALFLMLMEEVHLLTNSIFFMQNLKEFIGSCILVPSQNMFTRKRDVFGYYII